MPTNYKPLIQSGFGVGISGQHVYVESGLPVVVISGLHVQISGQHVFVESGVHVVADIAESGLHVQISGQHVFVESGVHVIADVEVDVSSGLNVVVASGVHVEEVAVLHSGAVTVDSGLPVVVESGLGVSISGQHVFVESGVYLASGMYVVADIAESGIGVQVQSGAHVQISGQHVFVESGVYTISDCSISGNLISISGNIVSISGQHLFVESGAFVTTQPSIAVSGTVSVQSGVIDVREYGYHVLSGEWRPKAVCDSGEIVVCSGLYVVADIAESGIGVQVQSGAHVLISGQHVYTEISPGSGQGGYPYTPEIDDAAIPGLLSRETVIALPYGWDADQGAMGLWDRITIKDGVLNVDVQSGLHVIMSGQHFYQESGAYVVIESGVGVTAAVTVDISGTPVTISGDHVFVESGAYVVVESGIGVVTTVVTDISGQIVTISGDHVFVESGVHVVVESGIGVVTDQATAGSGQTIHVGCADKIRTGKLVQVVGGTSGSVAGSGGMSLCVSGYWCSGPIHTIIIKNLADNDPVYIGEANCKPYSGYGFLLAATEAINLDYCNVCDVYVFGMTSGQFITWIGTDY